MDIRNIQDKPILENHLNQMYSLAAEQLEGYSVIEGLPEAPLNINLVKHQTILKDFIGRVIEELTEGHESLLNIYDIMESVGWNYDLLVVYEDINAIEYNLINANEEQADALGFFTSLLIFSNILDEDLVNYYKVKGEDLNNKLKGGKEEVTLNHLMVYGYKLQVESDITTEHTNPTNPGFNVYPSPNPDLDDITKGFRFLNPTSIDNGKVMMFEVIYQLNIARNLLKNRPWKQTQVMTKEQPYQEALVKAFFLYLGYLAGQGFEQDSLLTLFFKKQKLNLWRQKTGY